jgi:hypothetical protein
VDIEWVYRKHKKFRNNPKREAAAEERFYD